VNPAYEKFSQIHNYAEYNILLKEVAKRLLQESAVIQLKGEMSKQLNETNDVDRVYQTSVLQLAEKQYDSFDQVLPLISQISELNLVYLMRKGGKTVQTSLAKATVATSPSPILEQESVVEQYCRRAQALMTRNNLAQARVELQDALKLEPGNSRCHALMGVVYLKQNQTTMAKVHINKALQLDSREPTALEGKKLLDLAQKASNQPPTPSAKPTQNKQSDRPGGGSLFGGLFGGKKK
jgi:tetratricopeptide (TPR) repeat protein